MKKLLPMLLLTCLAATGFAQTTYLHLTAAKDFPRGGLLIPVSGGMLLYGPLLNDANTIGPRQAIAKLSTDGTVLWVRQTSHEYPKSEFFAVHAIETRNGTIILSGVMGIDSTKPDGSALGSVYSIIATDSAGNWITTASFLNPCPIGHLLQLSDGTILMAGSTYTSPNEVASICFFDSTLNKGTLLQLNHSYSSTYSTFPFITECPDKTLLVAGSYNSGLAIIHLDRAGHILSSRNVIFPTLSFSATSIAMGADGSVVLGGTLFDTSSGLGNRSCIVQLNTSGAVKRVVAFDPFDNTGSCTVIALANGQYVVATEANSGSTSSHILLIDSSLTVQRAISMEVFKDLLVSPSISTAGDGAIAIASSAKSKKLGTPTYTFWGTISASLSGCGVTDELLSTAPISTITDSSFGITAAMRTVSAIPFSLGIEPLPTEHTVVDGCAGIPDYVEHRPDPPFVSCVNPLRHSEPIVLHTVLSEPLTVILRDIAGKMIYTQKYVGNDIQIPTTGLASGIYFIELQDANSFATIWRAKVVVE